MPIRIYALAKELKIDNKKLVDICTKAGITGKGSALASLTDEELATLKTFMAGGRAGRSAAPAGRLRKATRGEPLAAGPVGSFRREDYIAPGGMSAGKVPVLPPRVEKPAAAKKKPAEEGAPAKPPEKEKEKSAPAMKLAPVPSAVHPPRKAKAKEPAPQKPDIKLPADAIRATPCGQQAALGAHSQARGEEGQGRGGRQAGTLAQGPARRRGSRLPAAGGTSRNRSGAAAARRVALPPTLLEEKEGPPRRWAGGSSGN